MFAFVFSIAVLCRSRWWRFACLWRHLAMDTWVKILQWWWSLPVRFWGAADTWWIQSWEARRYSTLPLTIFIQVYKSVLWTALFRYNFINWQSPYLLQNRRGCVCVLFLLSCIYIIWQIVEVTRNCDINFCKAFWEMNENDIMHVQWQLSKLHITYTHIIAFMTVFNFNIFSHQNN